MFYRSYQELDRDLKEKDSSFWIKQGEEMALNLFHRAAVGVPAYKDFLRKNNVDHEKINSVEIFKKEVPEMNKESYVKQHSLVDLCWNGEIAQGSTIVESSGTSGKTTFWVRSPQQEQESVIIHEAILTQIFRTNEIRTLFIVCFHMGSHVAGQVTVSAIKNILNASNVGSIFSPGLDKEDILRSLAELSSFYEQTILIGYPPFIKDVVDEAIKQGIDIRSFNIKFIFAGEGFPESWRSNLLQKVGGEDSKNAINIYGSADFGLLAHETPFSIIVRKMVANSTDLLQQVSGGAKFVPAVFSYYPWSKFFEAGSGGEIICTTNAAMPLIRYNTQDRGKVLENNEIKKFLNTYDGKLFYNNLPLVSVSGRNNNAVTFYALNIYPEHVQEILAKSELAEVFSGKFFLETKYNKDDEQKLYIHLELKNEEIINENTHNFVLSKVVDFLEQINLEYKKLRTAIGAKAIPSLKFYKRNFLELGTRKSKYNYADKKVKKNMVDEMKTILSEAIKAPSGHNAQPWRFKLDNNKILIFNMPERDTGPYNFEQKGSFLAHGALLENLKIISKHYGYNSEIKLFSGIEDLVATVEFEENNRKVEQELYKYIQSRSTNRKPYRLISLQIEHRNEIINVVRGFENCKMILIENTASIKVMAEALSLNEELFLENYVMHKSLFEHIIWSKRSEAEFPVGLNVKTLELVLPKLFIFKLCSKWKLLKKLNKLGLSKFIAKENSKVYMASSAFGIITVSNEDNHSYIEAGNMLQRMWLKATSLGLSVQPIAALPYLFKRVSNESVDYLNEKETNMIREKMENINNLISNNESTAMIVRIGYSSAPSARSLKLEPLFED